jgi:hypothetical protein
LLRIPGNFVNSTRHPDALAGKATGGQKGAQIIDTARARRPHACNPANTCRCISRLHVQNTLLRKPALQQKSAFFPAKTGKKTQRPYCLPEMIAI